MRKFIKKYFLVLIFVTGFFNVCNGQNEYGILVKTRLFPFLGWNGSHGGYHRISFGNNNVGYSSGSLGPQSITVFKFKYVNDDPNSIECDAGTAGNYNGDCDQNYSISYDKNTFISDSFSGCIGNSSIMGIHIFPATTTTTPCIEDIIKLSNGYNWQYSYDPSNPNEWKDFPSQFQQQRNISFKINQLSNYIGKNRIHFRAGYLTQFTNIRTYDIKPCPIKLINPLPIVVNNICSNGATGSATFTFNNDLNDDEHFLFNLTDINEPSVVYSYNVPPDFPYLADRKFTWPNLKSGRYKLKYQTFNNVTNQETSVGYSDEFTITAPPSVTFSTTQDNIKCKSAATGKITITAFGGSNIYKYQLNGSIWQDSNIFDNLTAGTYNILVKDSNDCVAPGDPPILIGTQEVTLTQPSESLTFSTTSTIIEPTSPTATDGKIIGVSATGGTGLKTYSWTNSLTPNVIIPPISSTNNDLINQPTGTYTCTATDANGCKATLNVDLIPFYAVIQEIESINCVNSSNGKLEATIFGGTAPFSVTGGWTAASTLPNNRVFIKENLVAGPYTFGFSSPNGIPRSKSYTLNPPTALSAVVDNKTNVTCFGESNGKINITVSGGTQFSNPLTRYTFEWKNALGTIVSTIQNPDNLPIGTYSCLIKDSKGCAYNLLNQTIGQPAVLVLNSAIITPITVVGASTGGINISVSGGNPFANPLALYTFDWKNSFGTTIATTEDLINVPAGTYLVTVTDANGCATNPASISYTIDPPMPLSVNIQQSNTIFCFGKTVTLTANPIGGTQNYPTNGYVWKKNNQIIPLTTKQITNQGAGFYQVQITDSVGNIATSTTFELIQPTAITASHTVTNINCFGGNTGKIELAVSGGLSSATYTFEWYKNGNLYPQITQNIQDLTAGTYKVYVSNTKNCTAVIIDNIIVIQPVAPLSATISGSNPTGFGLSNGSVNLTLPTGGTAPYSFLWNNNASSQDLSNVPAGNYSVTITDAKGCTISRNKILNEPNALTANVILLAKISCNGNNNGSLKAIPAAGIAPYTYTWKRNGIVITGGNLQALSNCITGNYSVLVIDANGNQTTANYFLDQPNVMTISFATTPVPCNAGAIGSVTTTISGGTAPYKFSWSNNTSSQNIYNLSAGNYVLEVTDDNGCTKMAQAIVGTTSNMIVNKTIKNASCNGKCDGSIDLQISGGSGNYEIVWKNLPTANGLIVNNICAGNYNATIKDIDAKCSIPVSFSVTQPDALTLDLGEDKTICTGQKTTINGKIALENCTYSWTSTNGFTAKTAQIEASESGTYTLNITSSQGCNISDSITITQLSESITAEFLVASQTYKDEDIILINLSNIPTENYQWILPQQAIKVSETPQTVIMRFTEIGRFDLKLKTTNTSGCEAFANKQIIVEENPGLPNTSGSDSFIKEFSIAPNPATNGVFNVKVSLNQEAAISLTLHEIALGTLINQTNMPPSKEHLKVFNLQLNAGVYWMILRTPYGVQTKKIIVN